MYKICTINIYIYIYIIVRIKSFEIKRLAGRWRIAKKALND